MGSLRVTLLGFTLPDDMIKETLEFDPSMPVQSHAFAWNLVQVLRHGDAEVTLLSSDPASNIAPSRRILFRARRFFSNGIDGETLGFINVLALKHLTRFMSCLRRGTAALHRWHPDVLMIHGVHSPFLWYGVLIRKLLDIPIVVVLTDPPGVILPSDKYLERLLKRLDVEVVRAALRHADGVIALTPMLAADLAPNARSLVMEGIVGTESAQVPRGCPVGNDAGAIVYAGGLSVANGVDRLVEAVKSLPVSTSVHLRPLGKGPLAKWINEQSTSDSRIGRAEFLPREEVLQTYQSADLLVQPRLINGAHVRYSFPSKLLEYMASGTPVLSTRLPGIPAEYDPHICWIDDDSVEGIRTALESVLSELPDERRNRANGAKEFVTTTRSVDAQGLRIGKFLASVAGSSQSEAN